MTRPDPLSYPLPDRPAPGEAVQVAEGVLWMRLPLPMRLDHVNVYALDDGPAGWTVIDTGLGTAACRAAWDALMAGPLGGRPVWRVLLTHHHPDHVGLAGWFQTAHGAELWTTRTAWLFARMLQKDVQTQPAPETVAFWRAAGMTPDMIAARMGERPFNFADVTAHLPLGYRSLAEGESVTIGGRVWAVRLTGGHAPDHITLWERDGPLVIAGDQVLAGITPNVGVWPTEPQADPLADFLNACARLADHARDDQLVLPGHQRPFIGLPARLATMAAHHHDALDKLAAALVQPRSAADCFEVLFGRRIEGGHYGLALGEAIAHLHRLRAEGRVIGQADADGVVMWQATGDSVT